VTAPPVAFYCVADECYFLGAVAMVNSLRLHGHREPIFLLDRGLRPDQRRMLAEEAELVQGPAEAPPWLQKTIAPLAHPAEVMVLIDTDMIVTRPLGELIERARDGRLVAFCNDTDRFVPEWGELLDLGTARRGPYLSSGLLVLSGELGEPVLRLLEDRQARVDPELTFAGRNLADYPFLYPEQDVLNAILCTRVDPARIVTVENRLAANLPFDGVRIVDALPPRCAHADGTEPYVLHHFDRKPWLERLRSNVYSRLLTRLLLDPDSPLRLDPAELPRRLRNGPAAAAERLATDLLLGPSGVARRLRERRSRIPARSGSAAS
jgi:hypothetical protein